MVAGRLGVRELVTLVGQLPPGCALHRALDPDGYAWRNGEELAAINAELADRTLALLEAVHSSDKGGRVRKTLRIPRPGHAQEQEGTSLSQLLAMTSKAGGAVKVDNAGDKG